MYSIIKGGGGQAAFLNIPKCATQTLQSYEVYRAANHEYHRYPRRIAVVRHPNDRLVSLYNFCNNTGHCVPPECVRHYENFIDWVLDSSDEHVIPQSEFISDSQVNEIIKLSDLDLILTDILEHPIDRKNKSESSVMKSGPSVMTDYRQLEIQDKYSQDADIFYGLR